MPVVAPVGTPTTMPVSLHVIIKLAVVPLNVIVPVPWLAPKPVPVIVTNAPTAPELGDRLVIVGVPRTVKLTPLLVVLDTVTTTSPLVAPVGTVTTMLVALQLVTVAVVPLNATELDP